MKTKTFEVVDRSTFIPMLAVKLSSDGNENDEFLLNRTGLDRKGSYQICLIDLNSGIGFFNSDNWKKSGRSIFHAHEYIEKNFDTLESGSVIDVEFILGETSHPKLSERVLHNIIF
jgi:hypothetical protein